MTSLPVPPASFLAKKTKILESLDVPDEEYSDLSPKGSVDIGIRPLIREINQVPGLVTTSSCAGRVSVFVEGRKKKKKMAGGETTEIEDDERGDSKTLAAVGGKGGGGTWLFVSHDPVEKGDKEWREVLGLQGQKAAECTAAKGEERLVHFKFEPMILHILTASPAHAQLALRAALQAGFRESGSLNVTPDATSTTTPMVGVRSMGLSFESLLGHRLGEETTLYVPEEYLDIVMKLANERFVENTSRIARFREEFLVAFGEGRKKVSKEGGEWEDAEVRRTRKREEGLRRKAEKETERVDQKEEEVEVLDFSTL